MPVRTRIERARAMRRWADQQGGYAAQPDGFDRRDEATLASLVDQWLERLSSRAYSPRTVSARVWALRSFLGWAEPRGLLRPEQIDKTALEGFQRFLWVYRKDDGKPLAVGHPAQPFGRGAGIFCLALPGESFARQSRRRP